MDGKKSSMKGKGAVNTSNMVALHAELHRKRTEARQNSTHGQIAPLRVKKPLVSHEKKEKVERALKQPDLSGSSDWEEQRKLDEAKIRLEAKSRLYEQLTATKEALGNRDISDFYLVNFEKKILTAEDREDNDVSDESQKLRREMQRAELLASASTSGKRTAEEESSVRGVEDEEEETEYPEDGGGLGPVRYQELLGEEIRSHGASYFRFSTDELLRQSQQEALLKAHEDAQAAQATKARQKEARQKELQKRLQKVRERRMLRAGLPLPKRKAQRSDSGVASEEQEDQSEQLIGPVPAGPPSSMTSKDPVYEAYERRKRAAEEKAALEAAKDEERKRKVRPWDIGKKGVILTEEAWLERQREERNPEFAPPSFSKDEFVKQRKVDIRESMKYAFKKAEDT